MSEGARESRRTKLERVIDEYELPELESVLVERWTAEGKERWSLRDLADFVNQRLLETAQRDAGQQPLEGEVQNQYRLLTSDDVSAGAETEAREQLDQVGIDVDELLSDFVSHQAVHTYLTECQELSYSGTSEEDRLVGAKDAIRRLESRTETVTENILGSLGDVDVLDLEEFSVITSVTVLCEECGTQQDIEQLFESEGCDCGAD